MFNVNLHRLIFSRQYHINCLSMQNTYVQFFCNHIISETDMHIISIFSRQYQINRHIFVYGFAPGRVLFQFVSNFVSIPHLSTIYLSFISPSSIYQQSIKQLSIICLSSIYDLSIINLSSIYHLSFIYL